MKVRLLKDNGMEKARAGDIIEVDPAHGDFLICYGWAETAADAGEQAEAPETQQEKPKKPAAKKPEKAEAEKPAAKAAAKKPAAKKAAAKK